MFHVWVTTSSGAEYLVRVHAERTYVTSRQSSAGDLHNVLVDPASAFALVGMRMHLYAPDGTWLRSTSPVDGWTIIPFDLTVPVMSHNSPIG